MIGYFDGEGILAKIPWPPDKIKLARESCLSHIKKIGYRKAIRYLRLIRKASIEDPYTGVEFCYQWCRGCSRMFWSRWAKNYNNPTYFRPKRWEGK